MRVLLKLIKLTYPEKILSFDWLKIHFLLLVHGTWHFKVKSKYQKVEKMLYLLDQKNLKSIKIQVSYEYYNLSTFMLARTIGKNEVGEPGIINNCFVMTMYY